MPKIMNIKQDGKNYTFQPGENGQLTAPYTSRKTTPIAYRKVSKTIGPSPEVRKNRMRINKAIVGAIRG